MIQKINIQIGLVILFMGCLMPNYLMAHEGHDHAAEETAAVETLLASRSEANNELIEVLLKFTPAEPGDSLQMRFYVADYRTNKPIVAESLVLTNLNKADQNFEVKALEEGVYLVRTVMPEELVYALKAVLRINGVEHVFALQEVDFAHHHLSVGEAHEHSYLWMYIVGVLILIVGLLLGRFTAVRKYNRQVAIVSILLAIPLMDLPHLCAHEGHDETPKKVKLAMGNNFELAKESQFLMQIYTDRAGEASYQDGRKLYGTIIPSSGGQSRVIIPQTGRITQLNVSPGQSIGQGAVLATIERTLDPSSEVLLASERNKHVEEVKRLEKELARLRGVSDIVSKKELENTEAAFAVAKSNLELYTTGSKTIVLRSPIGGVVSAFTYQVGDALSSGAELMTITNINQVYVETQAFEKDVAMLAQSKKFLAQCADGNHATNQIRLLSLGVEFNSANQSQKVLFEVDNTNGDFKLGEFVNVWTYVDSKDAALAVPNSAITELQGRPVVFVKHTAEQLELRYVSLGRNNGNVTEIQNGLKNGEHFVTEGAYQCKLVYLNQ
jgi:membrane fusion protein, heavy metal efflux system